MFPDYDNHLQKFDPELFKIISVNDQVMLVRGSLYESVLTGDWTGMSFYRFMNRAAFNLRTPYTFVIFDRPRPKIFRAINANPPPDPLFSNALQDAISRMRAGRTAGDLGSRPKKRHAINIVSKHFGYCFVPLQIKYEWPRSPYEPLKATYEPITNEARAFQFLEAVFSDFGPELRRVVDATVHTLSMLTATSREYQDQTLVRQAESSPATRDPLPSDIQYTQIRAEAFSKNVMSCGSSYKTQRKNPLIAPKRRMPANVMTFAKVFDRKSVRYGAYHYTCRPIIPELQQLDLLKAFHELGKLAHTRTDTHFYYVPPTLFFDDERDINLDLEPHNPKQELPRECKWRFASGQSEYRDADELFWNRLVDPNYGPHYVLELLNQDLPDCTRLFPDGVLTSSLTEVINEPLQYPRLGALRQDAKGTDELLRLAAWHYVFSLMVVDAEDKPSHHAIITLPFRCAGATSHAVCTMRSHTSISHKNTPVEHSIINQHDFPTNYMVYKSLMVPYERRLRRRTKENYILSVADIIAKDLYKYFEADPTRNIETLDESVLVTINTKLAQLTAYYSYAQVILKMPSSLDNNQKSLLVETRFKFYLVPELHDNSYFDITNRDDFLFVDDLMHHVPRAIASSMTLNLMDEKIGHKSNT